MKEGLVLTLWLSQPSESTINETQIPEIVSTLPDSEAVFGGFREETVIETTSDSEPQSELDSFETEKVMNYRGNAYKVNTEQSSSNITPNPTNHDSQNIKKRMYRGRAY